VQATLAPNTSQTGIVTYSTWKRWVRKLNLFEGIPKLDAHFRRQQGITRLGIVGRGYPLLYHIISSQLSLLNRTLCIVDLSHRFSPSHLGVLDPSLLQHIHVFFPTPANLTATLESLEDYMMYGEHGSKGKVWAGTIVIGDVPPVGAQGKGNIYFALEMWKGWVRVERKEVARYPTGVSPKEVVVERDKRQDVVDEKGWRVSSEYGEYIFSQL